MEFKEILETVNSAYDESRVLIKVDNNYFCYFPGYGKEGDTDGLKNGDLLVYRPRPRMGEIIKGRWAFAKIVISEDRSKFFKNIVFGNNRNILLWLAYTSLKYKEEGYDIKREI